MLADLSNNFIQNILGLHEIEGAKWIIDLPKIVKEIEQSWLLKVAKPFPNLSYHFVAPCVLQDKSEAVLKLAIPEKKSPIFNEKKILEIFNGEGAVRVLRFDERFYALLLEKLTPGENLVKICQKDDAQSNFIAIQVLQRLLTKTTTEKNDFPLLKDWVSGLQNAEKPSFAPEFVKKAREFLDELIASSNKSFLLHGDLHHQNILSATREEFLAIDPKGIIGDIGFEISTFLNNPRGWVLSHPEREKIIENRLEQFSEAFEIEPRDLQKWAFSEAVLSAWWTFEESRADWEKWIACAEIWRKTKFFRI